MLHLKLKQDVTQTIKETKQGIINKQNALDRLDSFYVIKDELIKKGYKREVKNYIYDAKKIIKKL